MRRWRIVRSNKRGPASVRNRDRAASKKYRNAQPSLPEDPLGIQIHPWHSPYIGTIPFHHVKPGTHSPFKQADFPVSSTTARFAMMTSATAGAYLRVNPAKLSTSSQYWSRSSSNP